MYFDLKSFDPKFLAQVAVDVQVEKNLKFQFRVKKPKIHLPQLLVENLRERRDELWKSDCFELFWSIGGKGYFELNLSPQGHWQAYEFSSYREGRKPLALTIDSLSMAKHSEEVIFEVEVSSPHLSGIRKIHPTLILREGPTTGYFASSHPEKAPDFHDQNHWTNF